ncbi:hypothetical protein M5K25_007290 [Dendrobium thyrsiflorum]|uniref:Symplekin/Pta1 N-terminal domain-containing protein n=1 Tax=Dendrobium thyrsiflorum TaxID=117978 RepID=A0ABD0VL62_DENTH
MGSKLAEIQPRETQVYMSSNSMSYGHGVQFCGFIDLDREGLNDGRGPASHRIFLEFESSFPNFDNLMGLQEIINERLRVLKELGRKVTEDSLVLLPKLLSFLKHDDPFVVKRSITTGTSLFCAVLVEIAVQLNKSDRPERWLEKMWSWMLQFKDAVFGIVLEQFSLFLASNLARKYLTAEIRASKEEIAEFFLRFEKSSSNFGFFWMAAKKIDALEERLEGEMNQIKETVEERMSSMEGQVADLRDMMKKMLEFQTQSAASDAKGPEAKNINSEIHREEEEVEIVEGRRGIPHLEPLQREERGGAYGERQGYGGMEPKGAGWEHPEGYYGRRGAVFEDRRGDFEGGMGNGRAREDRETSVQALYFRTQCYKILLPGSIGTKVLAVKFLETCVLTLTSDEHVGDAPYEEGKERDFNVSWLMKDHPVFNPAALAIEANSSLKLLLDLLRSADSLRGSLTIAIMNCIATIARKRPLHYDGILAALLAFTPNDHTLQGGHVASVRYSLRTAFLGFLKCNHPSAIESRDKLVRWLRSTSPGEAVEQVIRQLEKMSRMERMSRDVQVNKDDELSGQISTSKDLARIRSGMQFDDISSISEEMPQKKMRFSSTFISIQPVDKPSDMMDTPDSASDFPLKDDLSPVEKMIAMIGALLAEGERGSESLEILISNIHADLLADIVLETMKHLPKNSLSSSGINGNSRVSSQMSPRGSLSHEGPSSGTGHGQPPFSSQNESTKSVSSEITMPTLDMPALSNILADFKRDPRRDPRRFDPRLAVATAVQSLPLNSENDSDSKNELYQSKSNLISSLEDKAAYPLPSFASKDEDKLLDSTVDSNTKQLASNEPLEVKGTVMEAEPLTEAQIPVKSPLSTMHAVELELSVSVSSDAAASQSIDNNPLEPDQYSSPVSSTLTSEDASHDLPMLPVYVELTTEQKKELCNLAIARIFKDCKKVCAVPTSQPWLPLLARLVSQSDADGDMVSLLQSHIISDCDRLKGHELTMLVLYHIHAIMISESNESSNIAASNYERFLLSSAKGLIDSFPASDKSFSRLLGEAPFLPDSALRFLEDVCYSSVYDHLKKDASDGDRATQGLGTLWSLILSRPSNRLACLEIALKMFSLIMLVESTVVLGHIQSLREEHERNEESETILEIDPTIHSIDIVDEV